MWFRIAIFEAFLSSLIGIISKKQVKTIHPIVTLFINLCFVLVFMLIIILLLGGIPMVTPKFFILMFCSSVLDVVAFSAGYYALKHTQISLLSPLGSLIPVFATFFGVIFLHEIPTPVKLLGIITIVAGIYLLNVVDIKGGILKPFQKLFEEKGVRIYLIQVILWGITPIFQKLAIFETHPTKPLFASFFGFLLVASYLSVFALGKIKREKKALKKNMWLFFLFGMFYAVCQFAGYTVLSMTQVGYATAIFSLSSLLTIILGGVIFKESKIGERLVGAVVIIIGAFLLAI